MTDSRMRTVVPHRFTEADGIPDITIEDLITLDEMWNASLDGEMSPNKAFIHAFSQHYAMLRPYMSKLESGHDVLYAYWKLIYQAFLDFQNTSSDYDQLERTYAEPANMVMAEERAKGRMLNAETAYRHAEEDFYSELDWRQAEMGFLYDLTEKLKVAETFEVLRELAKQKAVLDNAGAKARAVSRFTVDAPPQSAAEPRRHTTFFGRLFQKLPCLQKNEEDVFTPDPSWSDEVKQKKLQELKDKLAKDWGDQYLKKEDEHNELSLKPLGNEYKEAYKDATVKRLHHRLVASRQQGKDVMYHGLRLYALCLRLYYRMYGENPVAESSESTAIEPIRDRTATSAEIIAKVKNLFKQLICGIRSNLYPFYCKQPAIVTFNEYLESMNQIASQEERLSFLKGENDPKVLDQVFIEFETPEEAYTETPSTRLGY